MVRRSSIVFLMSAALLGGVFSGSDALGDSPRVVFDAAQTIACRDITTPAFSETHPNERLWEAKLEVSSLIHGAESKLTHYFYQVDSINTQVVFQDYLPRTTLATAYAKPVDFENKREKTNQVGVSVAFDSLVKLGPSASSATKKTTQVRYSLLPPKEQMAASGTLRRGRGVYFKLRPSTQHTLEGAKDFVVIFRAPLHWRAGALLLRCQSFGVKKTLFAEEPVVAGSQMFMLATYRAGDNQAMQAAREYAEAELGLRRAARAEGKAIARQQSTAPKFPLGEPQAAKVPRGWLERLLISPGQANWPQYAAHLPDTVRQSGDAFLSAKHSLYQMQ